MPQTYRKNSKTEGRKYKAKGAFHCPCGVENHGYSSFQNSFEEPL
jgi:hypothetical protein